MGHTPPATPRGKRLELQRTTDVQHLVMWNPLSTVLQVPTSVVKAPSKLQGPEMAEGEACQRWQGEWMPPGQNGAILSSGTDIQLSALKPPVPC